MSPSLKDLALKATQVICVAYTDAFSVGGQSLVDLQLGCRHGVVSSNQDVLKNAPTGSLAVVTSQSGHFVMGLVGEHISGPCTVWRQEGGSIFKYAREFTPITDVLLRKAIQGAWEATCEIHDTEKRAMYMFNSRFCSNGRWYMEALHSAIEHDVFPISTRTGTRTVFA
jgi:hypothetical protein